MPQCCLTLKVSSGGGNGRKKVVAHFNCGASAVTASTTAASGERPEPSDCIPFLQNKCAGHLCGSETRKSGAGRPSPVEAAVTVSRVKFFSCEIQTNFHSFFFPKRKVDA